ANGADNLSPTAEELKAFTVAYDVTTRPDLVSRWIKLMAAVSDAAALDELKEVLSPADLKLVSGFQKTIVNDQQETDRLSTTMFQNLCRDILALDGAEIARRVVKIDQAIDERRESLVKSLLNSLSEEGAARVMRAAEKSAKMIRGSYTDVPAI